MRLRHALAPALALLALASGCETVTQVGTAVGVAAGTITPGQAQSIQRSAAAVGKAMEEITPEQEYYIGRAVAATLLASYRPFDAQAATRYLNTLGKALALASDRPQTFGGYHFLIVDTDEINAFAAPGGLVLVSRGLLRCCHSEDAVAAVLAHEVAHVQLGHGLAAIEKSRLTSALTILAAEGAKSLGGQQIADLTRAFEGSIGDITQKLVTSGYSRAAEREADRTAVTILTRVGYDPSGLKDMLLELKARTRRESGFGKTHPDPEERIADLGPLPARAGSPPPERQARFTRALAGV